MDIYAFYMKVKRKNHFLDVIINLFLVVKTLIRCIMKFLLVLARMGFEKNFLFLFFLD